MKAWLHILLAICLALTFMGCTVWKNLNTYPPGYEPSDFERNIGPPMWYLNEKPN